MVPTLFAVVIHFHKKVRSSALLGLLWSSLGIGAFAQTAPPNTYYNSAIGLSGAPLKIALHDIIKNHTVLPYTDNSTDTWDALHEVDRDPANANNIILIYSGLSQPISEQDTGSGTTAWNREHLWPQSLGVDNNRGMTDIFNLRPCNKTANGVRGNKPFDVSTGSISTNSFAPGSSYDSDSWEPRDGDKGNIARSLMYMDVRYDGTDSDVGDLTLVDSTSPSGNQMGKLSTLLTWHRQFAVTDSERLRNHKIYTTFQHNRNPFIDHPEWVDVIFAGTTHGLAWKRLRFTTTELANTAISGDAADPDRDGVPNLAEYKFHRQPRVNESAPLLQPSRLANGRLQLVFVRDRFATDAPMSYEISSDLKTWMPATPTTEAAVVSTFEVEQVTAQFTGPSDAFFVRLKVTAP